MNKKINRITFASMAGLLFSFALGQPVIIFDLGGVLLDEAEINIIDALPDNLDIGPIDENGRPPRIFTRMFEFANLIFNKDCKREWIIGTTSGKEIVQKIKDSIDKTEYDYFFKNSQERNLIKYGAELILLPENVIKLTKLNEQGLKFVRKCKSKGIHVLILSNWDPESFALIKNKFPELFSLFNESDIFIPAHIGYIKPETQAFDYIIKNKNFDIEKVLFIDDSATNVAGAQQYGIKGITHRSWLETENIIF